MSEAKLKNNGLYIGLRRHGLFSVYFGLSTGGVLGQLTFEQSCWRDDIGVDSHKELKTPRESLEQETGSSQGRSHQFVVGYQIVSPEDSHAGIYIYIHKHIRIQQQLMKKEASN